MSGTSVTTVIDKDLSTEVHRPRASWSGYIAVQVYEPGTGFVLDVYITDDKARELVDQITAALATTPEAVPA